jgi:hypothetical protein
VARRRGTSATPASPGRYPLGVLVICPQRCPHVAIQHNAAPADTTVLLKTAKENVRIIN